MIGTQLGSYRIVSKIGEGGMGSVYVAEHTLLKRKVAVKVLLKELTSDASIKRRFLNEARATSQIVHPGIVRMWDFGEHTDGTTYILMELLEGETLRDRIARRGRYDLDHALALLRQIAEALGAAHAQKIVHRDLKPENIFLVADPAASFGVQPKILDFGIAKILDPSIDAPQTRAGSIIGTPMYMSPEQCLATPEIDHRADLYSLGAIFFLLLCGRPPFDKGNFGDLLAAHLHQAPPRPSSVVASLPVWIDEVVLRLLAKDREQRFQSTDELLDALRAGRESRRIAPEAPTIISSAAAAAAHLTPPGGAKAPPHHGAGLMTPTPAPLTTPTPDAAATRVDPATPRPGGEATPAPKAGADDVSRTRAHSAEELAMPQLQRSRASIPILLGGAFGLTIVLGLGGFFLVMRARRAAEETRPTGVHFFIDSDPQGADVYRDGKTVCVTPCSLDEKPHAGEQRWVVAKQGYSEEQLTLPADHDGHARVTLQPDKSQ
jgi:serine/threonine-protein kinase